MSDWNRAGGGFTSGSRPNYLASAATGFAVGYGLSRFSAMQRERAQAEWDWLVHSNTAANMAVGMPLSQASALGAEQAHYIILSGRRSRLWWTMPLKTVLYGLAAFVTVMMVAIVLFFALSMLGKSDGKWFDPTTKFMLNIWLWLGVGVLLAWWESSELCGLPFIPLGQVRLKRPWFPGDPHPVPGSGRDGAGRTDRSQPVSHGESRGTLKPSDSLEVDIDAETQQLRDLIAAMSRGRRPDPEPQTEDLLAAAQRLQADALKDLAKIEVDARSLTMRIRIALSGEPTGNQTRLGQLAEIEAALEPAYDNLRRAVIAADTSTARSIVQRQIQPRLDEIRLAFGDVDVD